MTDQRVLAVLGAGVVPADTPVLRADDLGLIRGDGIFEVAHVRDGRAWLLDEHLARLAHSAARMDLTLPAPSALRDLVAQALAQWPADVEGGVRLVVTRGPETGGPATVFATVLPVSATNLRGRHHGIRVRTATLGFPATLRSDAPWLLGGAKTLSYAVNMASQRWAQSQGADDLLWISSDGYALEAPTSNLVWLDGQTLCTVPAATTGILAGITAAHLFAHAGELGWRTDTRMIAPAELARVDGAWLTSSLRGIAAIRELDGVELPYDAELTGRIRAFLGFP